MQLYLYSHIQPHSPFSSTCEPPCLPFTPRFLIAQQWLSRCEYVVVLQLLHTNPWAWVCVDVFFFFYGNSAEEKRHFWNHNSWNSLEVWCVDLSNSFLWLSLHLIFFFTTIYRQQQLLPYFFLFLLSWQTLTFNLTPPTFMLRHINQYENIFSGISSWKSI